MSIAESLKNQAATWFVGAVIGLLAVFSGKLTEQVKFALNREDLRAKNYEDLSTDLSEFAFNANLLAEFFDHNWTTRETMIDILKSYNDLVVKILKKDFVYRAWIKKYWGHEQQQLYSNVATLIREYDNALHSFNDEFEAVNITKTKDKFSPERAKEAARTLHPIAEKLKTATDALLLASM